MHCFRCLLFSGHAAYGDAVKLGNLTTDKYYVQGNTGLVVNILRKDSSELTQQDERGRQQPCVTSVTISLFETTFRQISLSFEQFFVKDQKTLVASDDHGKTRK